jgi:hypothetical protein
MFLERAMILTGYPLDLVVDFLNQGKRHVRIAGEPRARDSGHWRHQVERESQFAIGFALVQKHAAFCCETLRHLRDERSCLCFSKELEKASFSVSILFAALGGG